MEQVSTEKLQKIISRIVKDAKGEPVGLKAVQKQLEKELGLDNGSLNSRKTEIRDLLTAAMEESEESESEEEVIVPRKNTRAATKVSQPNDNNAPAKASEQPAGSTEPVAVEDDEASDKTAGKSRAGQQPDHQGFLKKRGDQGRIKLWRKRHFRLYRKEGVIAYFKSDKDNEQLGEIAVTGAFLIEKREDIGKNAFTITMKTTARVWILQAPDEATVGQWINVCTPLMKETAPIVIPQGGKKPRKPAPGLPLAFPPTYVQGFSEVQGCASVLQSGDLDWTKLSHKPVTPVALAPGQVAIALYGSKALVEEVREIALDGQGEGFVTDVPKQLKYSAESVGWSSADSQLQQSKFLMDEKTQRDLLKKLTGRKVTVSVPGNGAGHGEDYGKKQETRAAGEPEPVLGAAVAGGFGGLAFPADAKFTGKLYYDALDERYALVDEATNTVHFLNTRDARTIQLADANVQKLNAGTVDTFSAPRLWTKFAGKGDKTVGQLTYKLKSAFETHIGYVVSLSADEKTADVQGWYSVQNKTSKTYENAVLTVVPEPVKPGEEGKAKKKTKEEEVGEVAADEGKKEAEKKGFGGLMNIASAFLKGDGGEKEEAPLKVYQYPVVQKVTLPSYDWSHVAFLSQNVGVKTQHLVTFGLPSYTIKPVVDKEAGTSAEGKVATVVRFANPLGASLPGGKAQVNRRDRSGLGSTIVSESSLSRVEGGETVTIELEKTFGIKATRVQTGYNFDHEKHFIIETVEITVVNSRNETVNVTVEESMFRWSNWEVPASKPAFQKTAHPRKIAWDVRLNHGEDITIKYTAFYSTFQLDSDFEPAN